MQKYAINLRDGRVVLCTNETITQIDYYLISEKVAVAIENGVLDKTEVITRIKQGFFANPAAWDEMLEQKVATNVRKSQIPLDQAEAAETRVDTTGKQTFDMDIPDDKPESPAETAAAAVNDDLEKAAAEAAAKKEAAKAARAAKKAAAEKAAAAEGDDGEAVDA